MRRPKRPARESTPLHAKQKALHEQQENLRKQMLELEQKIQDAPRVAALREQQRREVLARRAAERVRHIDSPRLADKRYDVSMTAALGRPRRALKSEKREARIKFFVLCIVLTMVVVWLVSVLP